MSPCSPSGPLDTLANIIEVPTEIALEAKIDMTITTINLLIVKETAAIAFTQNEIVGFY
jgi:hypothetical protein